jgi:hypothetical protein
MEVSVTPFFHLILWLKIIKQLVATINIPALLLNVLSVLTKLYYYLGIVFSLGRAVKAMNRKGSRKHMSKTRGDRKIQMMEPRS